MRLLFITQDFPPDVGGTQTYAYELALRLAGACEDFAVLAPVVPGANTFDATCPFEVIRVRTGYNGLAVLGFPTFWRLLKTRGFDATFHVQWHHILLPVLAQRRGWQGKIFNAAHGRELLIKQPAKGSWLQSRYDRLRRSLLQRAHHHFPVSHYTGTLLHELGIQPEQCTVVNNGADPVMFAPCDPTPAIEAYYLVNRKVILTVSRLVYRKGVDTVLDAIARLRQQHPELLYLIAGAGPDRARLEERVATHGLEDHVRFLGKVPHDKLTTLYSAADVFVMPARAASPDVEGFGIVFLEANACGTPVIGATTGGIPDAIRDGKTGLLVPPDDPYALSQAINCLLQDPDFAQQLGEAGRAHVLEHANWDAVAARLIAQLRALYARGQATVAP